MAWKPRPWFRKERNGWYVQMHGKQIDLGVPGPRSAASEAAAIQAFQQLFQPVATTPLVPIAGRPPGGAGAVPVRDAVEAFLAERGDLEEATRKSYRWYLGQLSARFGTLDDITKRAIEADARSRSGWSDDSRRNYLATVELLLRHHGRPVKLDKPPRGSAGAEAVIPESTYLMAVGAARGDLRALLVTLWNTGCRPKELRLLTVGQVDWESSTATLTRHKNRRRGKATRLIVFPPAALEVLEAQRAKYKTGLLFRTRLGSAYTCPGLTQAVWRLSGRIGKPLTSYGFRHAFATDALEKGIPDTHVAALLGHGSTRMVHAHYSHLGENARLLKEQAARIRPAAG